MKWLMHDLYVTFVFSVIPSTQHYERWLLIHASISAMVLLNCRWIDGDIDE